MLVMTSRTSAAAWSRGANGQATQVYRARNSEASPFRYTIHPQDQFRITMEIEDQGEEIAAIYHSHTKSPPDPSQTDINLADNWPDPLYLICSLAKPEAPERAGIDDPRRKVEEVGLDVA